MKGKDKKEKDSKEERDDRRYSESVGAVILLCI